MRRLSTWLILISLTALVGVVALIVLRPDGTVGDVAAIEETLAPQPQPQPPPQSQPAARPQPQPSASTLPTYPVQDTSLESLERTSARPIWLRIESIGVASEVNGYGVNPRTGQMDVPDNVTEVAWYEYGPSPGEAGSAVLAAHVDLAGRGPGVFYDLGDLEEGAIVEVGFDDGTTRRFAVEARTTYLKDELPLDAIFSRSGPPVLTLITCGGGFNQSVRSYDSNVVAYAVPIESPQIAS